MLLGDRCAAPQRALSLREPGQRVRVRLPTAVPRLKSSRSTGFVISQYAQTPPTSQRNGPSGTLTVAGPRPK